MLLLVAFAQAAPVSVPSAQALREHPPIVIAPPAPPAPPPSLQQLSPAARALVEAQDARVKALDNAELGRRSPALEQWYDALNAQRLDVTRLRKAGDALDSTLNRPGVFAGWADVMAKLGEEDRRLLVPHLRSIRGRVYLAPTYVSTTRPDPTVVARRNALSDAMVKLMKAAAERKSDPRHVARQMEIGRLQAEASRVARRRPFDVSAVKAAFHRVQALRNEEERARTDATVDILATLPADQRELLTGTLWADPSVRPAPPPPRAK